MGWSRIKPLGEGAAAFVSLARSVAGSGGPILPQTLAVKSAKRGTAEARALEYEGQIYNKLQPHPNIIKCYGSDESKEDGKEFKNLFLEYADGGDLFDRIHCSEGEKLSEKEVRSFTQSILKGLKHIHNKGVSHCDMKPENILLVGHFLHGAVPKIADFGHAILKDSIVSLEWKGSRCYMAPESVACGIYGPKVDIWAVGCIVVEMILGRRLTDSNSDIKMVASQRIQTETVELPPGISDEAVDFLDKCLQPNPLLRWDADRLLHHPFLADTRKTARSRCNLQQHC